VIDVWKDPEGVALALEEIFEIDFARALIRSQSAGASAETVERMERQVKPRSLAWGYYCFADYLLHLDALRQAGVAFAVRDLALCEAEGFIALHRARSAFEGKHPACSACGLRQQNRFGAVCPGCGAKFRRKKG
jgi:hypothetical protein